MWRFDVHLRETLLVPLWESLGDGLKVCVGPGEQDTANSDLVLLVSYHTRHGIIQLTVPILP
jgi:hypothetical protein